MVARPGLLLWEGIQVNILTAYFTISVAFNIVVTLAIVSKLLGLRRQESKISPGIAPYVSASAMLIESAALYSVFGIILIVAAGSKNSPLQNLVLPVVSQVQVDPSLFILAH